MRTIRDCKFCGNSHEVRKCPAYGKECSIFKNHFAKVCLSKTKNGNKATAHHLAEKDSFGVVTGSEGDNLYHISSSCILVNNVNTKTETIVIDSRQMEMQIDTGASVSVILSKMWTEMGKLKLANSAKHLEAYNGHSFKMLGKLTATVDRLNRFSVTEFIVVQSDKLFGLLGRDLLGPSETVYMSNIAKETEYLPTIKGFVGKMNLVEGAKNVFCRARNVPVALEEKVKNELDRLERRGIISKIDGGADNASPVVWIQKNGRFKNVRGF
jgi:hypothetical protein